MILYCALYCTDVERTCLNLSVRRLDHKYEYYWPGKRENSPQRRARTKNGKNMRNYDLCDISDSARTNGFSFPNNILNQIIRLKWERENKSAYATRVAQGDSVGGGVETQKFEGKPLKYRQIKVLFLTGPHATSRSRTPGTGYDTNMFFGGWLWVGLRQGSENFSVLGHTFYNLKSSKCHGHFRVIWSDAVTPQPLLWSYFDAGLHMSIQNSIYTHVYML